MFFKDKNKIIFQDILAPLAPETLDPTLDEETAQSASHHLSSQEQRGFNDLWGLRTDSNSPQGPGTGRRGRRTSLPANAARKKSNEEEGEKSTSRRLREQRY